MLTSKQEKFCHNIVKGMSQSDAYRDAYNTENMSSVVVNKEASILMSDRKISVRVEELRAPIVEKLIYSQLDAFKDFKDLKQLALALPDGKMDVKAAIKANEEMAKMAQLYVESKRVTAEVNVKDASAELLRELLSDDAA